jgi:transposase
MFEIRKFPGSRRSHKYTEDQRRKVVEKIVKLEEQGLSKEAIAKELCLPYGSVTGWYFRYHGHGIPKNL